MNQNRILALSDLMEFTPIVAKKAIYLANKYQKELDVLHIEDETFLKFFKEKTQCSLDKGKEILKNTYEDKAKIFCKCGDFIDVIKEHIKSNDISFVMAGFSKEKTIIEDIFGSSNLSLIIKKLDFPILVIKTEDKPEYKNILIPTDLSDASKKNIEYLVKLFPEANFYIEHYYKTFFESRMKLYGLDEEEAHSFIDYYETEAQNELDSFMEKLDIPQNIKVFKSAKKYVDIKTMIDEAMENKLIDLLSLSIGTGFSIFSFDLLAYSKKDVIIYKINDNG